MLRYYVLLALLCRSSLGYSTGAPYEACDTMKPGHGVDGQESDIFDYYKISCKPMGDDKIELKVKGLSDQTFKGVLFQIHDGSGEKIGAFYDSHRPEGFKEACDGYGVTHTDGQDEKDMAMLIGEVDPAQQEDAVCVFTLVQEKEIFWVKQELKVKKSADDEEYDPMEMPEEEPEPSEPKKPVRKPVKRPVKKPARPNKRLNGRKPGKARERHGMKDRSPKPHKNQRMRPNKRGDFKPHRGLFKPRGDRRKPLTPRQKRRRLRKLKDEKDDFADGPEHERESSYEGENDGELSREKSRKGPRQPDPHDRPGLREGPRKGGPRDRKPSDRIRPGDAAYLDRRRISPRERAFPGGQDQREDGEDSKGPREVPGRGGSQIGFDRRERENPRLHESPRGGLHRNSGSGGPYPRIRGGPRYEEPRSRNFPRFGGEHQPRRRFDPFIFRGSQDRSLCFLFCYN